MLEFVEKGNHANAADYYKKIKEEEKLFETKVFLKVWVKVKSGWADDIRFLRELGL